MAHGNQKFGGFLVVVVNRAFVVNSIHEWKAGHFFHFSVYSDRVPTTSYLSEKKKNIRHLRCHLMKYFIPVTLRLAFIGTKQSVSILHVVATIEHPFFM